MRLPWDITVRAIGIVTDNVKWIYNDSFVIPNPKATDKNNVRSNSVYEENILIYSRKLNNIKLTGGNHSVEFIFCTCF